MAEPGDRAEVRAIDRSERQGHVGLLLVLASALVGATVGLSLVGPEQAQTLIVGLLALLAMAGVFFLFALGIGAVAFVGQGTPNDLPKILADTASEGVVVVEDDGRVVYANETYLTLAGAESRADLRTIERLFTGAPEVSEAIYRLAQAAREQRSTSEEIRLSPALGGKREFGYDLAKVGSGGLTLSDIVPANVVGMMRAAEGGPGEVKTETFDLDLRRRNGQSLPVRLFHRVAFGHEGRPGASRTLVLNRSPGEDLDEGQRAAEVRFARFFNNTPIAIATVTRAGRAVRTNASFVRLFGSLPRGPGAAEGPSLVQAVHEPDRAALEGAIRQAAEGRTDIAPLDLGIAGEGGRSARIWTSPVSESDGEGEVAILYALDTTEQRQLEQQFAQAQKMQAVGQLAGGVAHDFNNVLQAIIGYSDLLLANQRPTDPSFQDIMQIKQNANRAASLVRQLLAFS